MKKNKLKTLAILPFLTLSLVGCNQQCIEVKEPTLVDLDLDWGNVFNVQVKQVSYNEHYGNNILSTYENDKELYCSYMNMTATISTKFDKSRYHLRHNQYGDRMPIIIKALSRKEGNTIQWTETTKKTYFLNELVKVASQELKSFNEPITINFTSTIPSKRAEITAKVDKSLEGIDYKIEFEGQVLVDDL